MPAALLLSGSGPLDRDSNMRGQRLDVASALADARVERGIASLRYDKRGVGESEGDYLETGFDAETQDALAALGWLGERPEGDPDRIALVGHSVGATVRGSTRERERSRRRSRPPQRGLRGPETRSCGASPTWIAATLAGVQRLGARWFLRRQEKAHRLLRESTGDVVRVGAQRLPARWFREYMSYDPADDLRAIACPVLAITAETTFRSKQTTSA